MSDVFGWYHEEPDVDISLTDEEREDLHRRLEPFIKEWKEKNAQKLKDKCKVELEDDLFNI
jgi:hypothetical protein